MAALFRAFLLLVVLHESQGMLLLLSDLRCGSLRSVALYPVLLHSPLDGFLRCRHRDCTRLQAIPNPLEVLRMLIYL